VVKSLRFLTNLRIFPSSFSVATGSAIGDTKRLSLSISTSICGSEDDFVIL
jgi:hypothetical protein